MFIVTIFNKIELFKIITFIPDFNWKSSEKVKICNTLTMAATVETYGIQEVRGSIPLVSTKWKNNSHTGFRTCMAVLLLSGFKIDSK